MSGNKLAHDAPSAEPASTRTIQSSELKRLNSVIEELERYKLFIDTLPQVVYEADSKGNLTYINQAGLTTLGLTCEDIASGMHVFDVIHPDDVSLAEANIQNVVLGANTRGNEYRLCTKEGEIIEALVFSSPIFRDGEIGGIRGIAINISDKKAAEEKSRIVREMNAGLAVSSTMDDVAGVIQGISERINGIDCGGLYNIDYKSGGLVLVKAWGLSEEFVARVTSYPPESPQVKVLSKGEVLHVRHSDLISQDDPIRLREGLKALSVIPVLHEGTLIAAINLSSHTVSEFSPRTLGIIDEVSCHIGGAIGRIRAETEMREQDARYKAIVDNSREVVFVLRPSSLEFMSTRIEELTGYTREELKGLDPISLLHPDDRGKFAPMWAVRGTNIPLPATFEFRIITKSSQTRVCQAALAKIQSHGEESVLGTVRDITDERKAQEEMLKVSKLDSLAMLAGGIAHDFNNLLAAVVGNISLAKEDASALGFEGAFFTLKEAEKACGRATDLNRQLLTFAKGGAPIKSAASLPEVVMETARFTLSGSDIAVIEKFPEDLWPVNIDSGQISQVVQNLIVNAMHAMAQGRTKRLEISAANLELNEGNPHYLKPGRYVRLSVEDFGCGIPNEHLSRIFDPFFTTKPTGNGLGLATSYSILQKHGGRIEAESTLGSGTTFKLFLPAAEGPVRPGSVSSRPISGHGRILIVDDESMVRGICRRLGSRLGYTMDEAKDGLEAVEMYNQAKRSGVPYDVVILDLTIPGGLGGLQTLPRLKSIDPNCFFVVSSGYSDSGTMADYVASGFDEVLAKPYSLVKLSEVLSSRKGGKG